MEGEIIGLPIGKKMIISSPTGMSLGKYHGLVWTESGQIFGWGCKNLGLGLRHYERVNVPLY
jgi:alpha-tubulin suppressor-like RCC1 family protein